MRYKVIDNYISSDDCEKLISDSIKFLEKSSSFIHSNRNISTCTSLEFSKLIENSEEWETLINHIKSKDFFNFCLNELNLKKKNYDVGDIFFKKNYSNLERKYKKLSNTNLQMLNTNSIIKYSLFRIFKNLKLKIHKFYNFIKRKRNIELLFDYSQAGNGYGREIHRDSDERLIVFLLYFNQLDKKSEGGTLDIYNYKNKIEKNINPQPLYEECELAKSIKPDSGKLVIFLNDDTSFHAVKELKNSKLTRHFLYGGFTLTSGKNPFIKSKKKMHTNFYIYY